MKAHRKIVGLLAAGLGLLAVQIVALAQSVGGILITYGPASPTPIPTMSQWAMLGLTLLLAGVAVYTLRRKRLGKPLGSVMLALALALGGVQGNYLIRHAEAVVLTPDCPEVAIECFMINAAGGTVNVFALFSDVKVMNISGVAQTIIGITAILPSDVIGTPESTPQCVVGLTLQPGESCYVHNAAILG